MARPGANESAGLSCKYLYPSLTIAPQAAPGGSIPIPINTHTQTKQTYYQPEKFQLKLPGSSHPPFMTPQPRPHQQYKPQLRSPPIVPRSRYTAQPQDFSFQPQRYRPMPQPIPRFNRPTQQSSPYNAQKQNLHLNSTRFMPNQPQNNFTIHQNKFPPKQRMSETYNQPEGKSDYMVWDDDDDSNSEDVTEYVDWEE